MSCSTWYPMLDVEEMLELDESPSGSTSTENTGDDSGNLAGPTQVQQDSIDDLTALFNRLTLDDTEMEVDQIIGGHGLDAEEVEICG